jgi:hypothetical protein
VTIDPLVVIVTAPKKQTPGDKFWQNAAAPADLLATINERKLSGIFDGRRSA